ncbi:MAG: sulfate permease, partial [Nitrospirae bacterium]|nr:sulfate permease [Nitrospirota bacterium]
MKNNKTYPAFIFNKIEFSGSLGNLGIILPLTLGMIVINGLNSGNVFIFMGLVFVITGVYFKMPMSVEPLKVISAYAIATGIPPNKIISAGLCMGIFTLALGLTGLINIVGKYTPKNVVRGIQFSVGVLLMKKGLEFMIKTDPNLSIQFIGIFNIGLIIGILGIIIIFFLLDNHKIPAALTIIAGGIVLGILIGKPVSGEIKPGIYLPQIFPYGLPEWDDILWALPFLVLPQIPMTIGNAIISSTELSHSYFAKQAEKVTFRSISISQGLATIISSMFGGIPICHGAGGIAAHYRFGARTGGANIMIGAIFISAGILLGNSAIMIFNLLPLSLLGALLIFAGLQIAMMIKDLTKPKDLFVAIAMLSVTVATNLAISFIAGIIIAYIIKS